MTDDLSKNKINTLDAEQYVHELRNYEGVAGNSDGVAWNSDGVAWNSDGVAWNSMCSMEFRCVAWNSDGVAWNSDVVAWNSDVVFRLPQELSKQLP